MSVYVGLDIGGTKLMAAASDDEGNILRKIRNPTPLDLHQGLSALNDMISEVANGNKITAIGAAIGGPLDWKRGVVSPLHQPQWRNVPLKAIMEKQWGCPFYVDVDTNVAAVGEYKFARVSVSRFLYITVSTGMGGGFLIDGKIYRGMN
ncbi:ROK family protein, partial [candidate division KSB1 bacterium]